MPRGVTLPELATVILLLGLMASVFIPPARRLADRAAVASARETVVGVHEATRHAAIARRSLARYEMARGAPVLTISRRRAGNSWDTLRVVTLEGIRITTSQRTVAFNPLGIGHGASNSTIILARGAAAETLTVSRTGRLRRW